MKTGFNIKQETISKLRDAGYTIWFQRNEDYKDHLPENAHFAYVSTLNDGEYKKITIRPTKKETTFSDIVGKFATDKVYKDFSKHFERLLGKESIDIYPTSYGIGVFIAITSIQKEEQLKKEISERLNELGVEFSNEYSDAAWVLRFRISKSKENIKKIEQIINNKKTVMRA